MKAIFKAKWSVLLAAILLLAALLAGCSQAPKATPAPSSDAGSAKLDKLIMGTSADFPPFEYKDSSGKVLGLDAEIAQRVADKLGVPLTIEDMDFDSLMSTLANGKVNMVLAGLTVDEDRKLSADFSNTYFEASQVIIIRKGDTLVQSAEDLKGKTIGVQLGTTGDVEMTALEAEGTQVARYKKGVDAVMDLINNRVDAVVIDAEPAKVMVKNNPDTTELIDVKLTEEEYAAAVQKGDAALLKAINEVIQEMKDSGEMAQLFDFHVTNSAE